MLLGSSGTSTSEFWTRDENIHISFLLSMMSVSATKYHKTSIFYQGVKTKIHSKLCTQIPFKGDKCILSFFLICKVYNQPKPSTLKNNINSYRHYTLPHVLYRLTDVVWYKAQQYLLLWNSTSLDTSWLMLRKRWVTLTCWSHRTTVNYHV